MSRSEEISKFIYDNIMELDVIGLASKKFNLTGSELEALKIASQGLAPISAMVSVFNCCGSTGRDGVAMTEEDSRR